MGFPCKGIDGSDDPMLSTENQSWSILILDFHDRPTERIVFFCWLKSNINKYRCMILEIR